MRPGTPGEMILALVEAGRSIRSVVLAKRFSETAAVAAEPAESQF
jgi:hypothetical protein